MLRLRAALGLMLSAGFGFATTSLPSVSAESHLNDPFLEPRLLRFEDESSPVAGNLSDADLSDADIAKSSDLGLQRCSEFRETAFDSQETVLGPIIDDGWSLTDTLQIFAGLDGSKQPKDFGINASFGGRVSANVGIPIAEEYGLGLQIGTSLNYADNAVAVMAAVDGRSERFQNFTTVGLFQRLDSGLEWALAYDFLYENYYDDIALSQFRSRVTQQVGETGANRVGLLGIWSWDEQRANVMGTSVLLRPIDQVSAVWNHRWATGIETELLGGVALGHGQVVAVFPTNSGFNASPVFGAMLHAPLNDWMALYGQGNFVLPADSGTVDAYLGFVVYFDKLHRGRYSRYSPVFDVANNTSFAVDLRR